jgi:hypothetical protein
MASPEAQAQDARAPSQDAPSQDKSPPLAPTEQGQSPWWSAPSGKPFGIPDFSHGFAALFAWLLPAPQPVPARVIARRR